MTTHAYTVSVSDGVGNEDLAAQEAASESGSEKLPEREERRQMVRCANVECHVPACGRVWVFA